jgi:acyl-CoA thioesterase-2
MAANAGFCQRGAVSFAELMTLERAAEDSFIAPAARYTWGFLYGGQLIGQALRAASATVAPGLAANSLHAYYLRSAEADEVLSLTVQRIRDGRSFSVRSVTATQGDRVIATMLASFHASEGGIDVQLLETPSAPAPDELESNSWSTVFDRRYAPTADSARTLAWLRLGEDLPDGDRQLHACALAFLADDLFDDPVIGRLGLERAAPDAHAGGTNAVWMQSLDYAVWFHRPVCAGGWLLHDFRCVSVANACATVVGEVLDGAGLHLATVAQQVLVRGQPRRSDATA